MGKILILYVIRQNIFGIIFEGLPYGQNIVCCELDLLLYLQDGWEERTHTDGRTFYINHSMYFYSDPMNSLIIKLVLGNKRSSNS